MLTCYAGTNGITLLRCPKDTCHRKDRGRKALETVEREGAFSRFRESLDLNLGQQNAAIVVNDCAEAMAQASYLDTARRLASFLAEKARFF